MGVQDAQGAQLRDLLQGGFRYALALTRHRAAAEDLLQDAWVAVLQARGPRNRAYLFAAIRSRFLNRYRHERLVSLVPIDEVELELANLAAEGDSDWLEGVDSVEVESALARLRPVEREAIFLSAVEDYTAQEIADLTSQPRSTVLSLIYRARQKLRRALGLPQGRAKTSP